MSKRSLELLVEDIWESIEKIERYIKGMSQDNFESDEKRHSDIQSISKGYSLSIG